MLLKADSKEDAGGGELLLFPSTALEIAKFEIVCMDVNRQQTHYSMCPGNLNDV